MTVVHSVGLWRNDKHEYYWQEPGKPLVGPLTSVTTAIKAVDKSGPLVGWAQRETAAAAVRHAQLLNEHLADHRVPDPLCAPCSASGREWKGPEAAAANWLKKMPGYQRDTAANLGTRVHILAEKIGQGSTPDMTADEVPFVAAYRRFLDEWRPDFLRLEAMVCNLTHAYAGTLDILAVLNGRVTLLDIKTGSGCYPETAFQLAALGNAEFVGWPEDARRYPLPQIDQYAVLHLRPELYREGYRIVPYKVTRQTFERFLDAKALWEWLQTTAKSVMGAPLATPVLEAAA